LPLLSYDLEWTFK